MAELSWRRGRERGTKEEGLKEDAGKKSEKKGKDNEGEKEIGNVTSGGFSPTLKKPISMGRIQSEYLEDLEKVYVKVRDKILPAIITKLPFIKTKYKI